MKGDDKLVVFHMDQLRDILKKGIATGDAETGLLNSYHVTTAILYGMTPDERSVATKEVGDELKWMMAHWEDKLNELGKQRNEELDKDKESWWGGICKKYQKKAGE